MQISLQSSTSFSNVLYSTVQFYPQNACEFKESLKYNMYLYFFLSTMNYSLPAGSPSIFGGNKKSKKRKPFKKLKKSYKRKQRGGQPKYQAILQTFSFLYNAVFQHIPDTNFLFTKKNNNSLSNSYPLTNQTELKETTNFDISDDELVERFVNLHSIQNLFDNQTGTCTLNAYLTLGSINLNQFAYLYNNFTENKPYNTIQILLRNYDDFSTNWQSYFNFIYNKDDVYKFMSEIIVSLKQLREKKNTNFMTYANTNGPKGTHALVVLLTSSNEIAFIDFQESISTNLNKKNKLFVYTVSGNLPKVLQSQSDYFSGASLYFYLEPITRCSIFNNVIFQIDNPSQSISSKNPNFNIATETVENVNFYDNSENPNYSNYLNEIYKLHEQLKSEKEKNSSILKEEIETKGYVHPNLISANDTLLKFYKNSKEKFKNVVKAKKTNNIIIKNKLEPENFKTAKTKLNKYIKNLEKRQFQPLPQGYLNSHEWPHFLPICSGLNIDLYKLYTLIYGKPFENDEQIFFQQNIPMTNFLSLLQSKSNSNHHDFLNHYLDILTSFSLNNAMTVSDFFSTIRDILSHDMTKTDANNKTNLAYCTSKNKNSLIYEKYNALQSFLRYIK